MVGNRDRASNFEGAAFAKQTWLFFGPSPWRAGSLFPNQESNLHSLRWKHPPSLNHWTSRDILPIQLLYSVFACSD